MGRQRSRPGDDDAISGPRETVDRDDAIRIIMSAIEGLRSRLDVLEHTPSPPSGQHPYRGGLPLSDLSVEQTAHGGIRLAPGVLEEIQRRLLELDAERMKAEAFAHGQKTALAHVAKESERRLRWLKWGLSLMVALGMGFGFMVRHLLH